MKQLLLIIVTLISSITNAQDFDFLCGLTSEQKKEERSIELEALKSGLPTGYIAFATDGIPIFYTVTGPNPCNQFIFGDYIATVSSTLGDLTDPEYDVVFDNAEQAIIDANAEIIRLAESRTDRIAALQLLFAAGSDAHDNDFTLNITTDSCNDNIGIVDGSMTINIIPNTLYSTRTLEELGDTNWILLQAEVEKQIGLQIVAKYNQSFEGKLEAFYDDHVNEPSSLPQSIKDKAADNMTNLDRLAFLQLLTYSTSEVVNAASGNPTVVVTINNKFFNTEVAALGLGYLHLSEEDFETVTLKVIQKIWSEVYSDPLIPTGLTMAQYNAANTAWDNSMKFELIQDLAITGVVDVSTLKANTEGQFITFSSPSGAHEDISVHSVHFGSTVLGSVEKPPFRDYYLFCILAVHQIQYPNQPDLTAEQALDHIFSSTTEPGFLFDSLAAQAEARANGSRKTLLTALESRGDLNISVSNQTVTVTNSNDSSQTRSFTISDFGEGTPILSTLDGRGYAGLYFETIRAAWNFQ